ncbi:hydantoinase/oxoprolinase family protein [Nocardioides sp. LHD-245]|uniref:hydantoinase/oxoprolinase family protein n=1 Tax=Nocardioides sp. LHD-245 TaxID=3051387 RepID=UPI0027E17ECD|nr:hydantoinase/oxoprolinase family protein [Nocardioides sp. LHD-245]
MSRADFRLGIDVGGTNTDAVLLDDDLSVRTKCKSPTTADVVSGIISAISLALDTAGLDPARVGHVMVSTTLATNALLQRRNLLRVAQLRIGAPATTALRLLCDWPEDLRASTVGAALIAPGGFETDGTEIGVFDDDLIRRFAEDAAATCDAFAVTGVFSPHFPDQELRAREIIREVAGEIPISLSHEIGSLGLVDRESAAALNAALAGVAAELVRSVEAALRASGVACDTYVVQNDGTLMSGDVATRYPVLSIGSGPASSIVGAQHLAGIDEAIVVDVGGTSTDIGVLVGGRPRSSVAGASVGGVRANFRMPDVISIGLGGGSVIHGRGAGTRVGPHSVGAALKDRAVVFGGDTLTMTDAAVWARRMRLGHAAGLASHQRELRWAMAEATRLLRTAVGRFHIAGEQTSVAVVVGGASELFDEKDFDLELLRPEHFESANAVGAAVARVSREVDLVTHASGPERERAVADAHRAAIDYALAAGADPRETSVIAVEETPLAYAADGAVRLRVRAAGPIARASSR